MMDSNNKWIKIDSWHLLKETSLTQNGTWMATTKCGLKRPWDQTFLDALPGGSETSCENCLIIEIGGEQPKPKPRRSRKAKA